MTDRDDFVVRFDFTSAQRAAERVRDMLLGLRKQFDLTPFEYCRKVRIAPTEIPYSHPEITLTLGSTTNCRCSRVICTSRCTGT